MESIKLLIIKNKKQHTICAVLKIYKMAEDKRFELLLAFTTNGFRDRPLQPDLGNLPTMITKKWQNHFNTVNQMVVVDGIEPPTRRASICCSTDWATRPLMATPTGLEPVISSVTGRRDNQTSLRSQWLRG